jgi:small-conductance mechanosensitive channel
MAISFLQALSNIIQGIHNIETYISIALTLFYIFLAVFLEQIIWKILKNEINRRIKDEKIAKISMRITSYILYTVLTIVLLYIIGIKEIFPAIAGTSIIISIILGLSLPILLQNFIAGITLIIENDYKVGDYISVSGFEGIIIERALRYTVIKDKKGNNIKIPNTKLISEIVVKKKKQ